MASRIVQYFADKLKSMKEYPITLTKAVYDESGNRLDNKLSEIEDKLTGLNSSLENVNNKFSGASFLTAYTTNNVITIPSGTYILFFVKTLYTQSSIWVIDGSGVMPLVNNCEETLTKTDNGDGTITLKFTKASYSRYFLVRLS